MTRLAALFVLVAGLIAPDLACARAAPAPGAQPGASVSWSVWSVAGSTVRLRFTAPSAEARLLVKGGADGLAQAVLRDLTVTSAAGDCPAVDQGQGMGQVYAMALVPGLDRFELVFVCPAPDRIVLHDRLFFAARPGHVDYALVRQGAAAPALEVFTGDRQAIALPSTGAGPLRLAALGALGLLLEPAALCALGGLFLLGGSWRDLAWSAGGLALGTLAAWGLSLAGLVPARAAADAATLGALAAVLGLVALRSAAPRGASAKGAAVARLAFVLAFGAAIAFAAWSGLGAGLAAAGLALFAWALVGSGAARAPWRLWTPGLLLGLLLGVDLTGHLAVLELPPARLAAPLAAYDLGRLALACTLLTAAVGLARLAARRLAATRPAALELSGSALVGLGVLLFVSQINA